MTQLPAYLANYQSKNLAQTALVSIGSGAPPTLSIEGGRFTIVDASGQDEMVGAMDPKIGIYVDVVMIDMLERKSKMFFGAKYDPNNPSPPKCFSDNGIAPSIGAGEPQSATCASCPQNVIGSAMGLNNKPVRACRDQIKAAVVLPQYPKEVFLLKIPPNSFKHLRTLTQHLEKNGMPLEAVVTRVFFEQGITGTLMFHASQWVDETLFRAVKALLDTKQTDALVGRTDVPRSAALAAPAATVPALPVLAMPQPVTAPAVTFVTGLPAPQPTQMAPAPQQQAPAPAAAPQTRRRRTAAAEQPQQPAQVPAMAPFQATQPAAPNGGAAFGMAPGQAPDPALMSTLDQLFPKQ